MTEDELERALAATPAHAVPPALLARVRADAAAIQAERAARGRLGPRRQLLWALGGRAGVGGLAGLAAAAFALGLLGPGLLGAGGTEALADLAPDLSALAEG
ncbi:MAG: hypothetical protein ACU0BS_11770 [Hasllibacter sp.]